MTPQQAIKSPVLTAGAAGALAVAIGVLVGLSSNHAALSAGAHRDLAASLSPAATPSPSGPPPPTAAGKLGSHAVLTAGTGWLLATGSGGAFESGDGGASWAAVALPAGASGLVIDPASSAHRLAGGSTLLESHDAGKSWQPARTQPPGPGPFTPLVINPTDAGVWFVTAHGAVLRTRDAAVSWRALSGLPSIANALLSPLGSGDRFVITMSGRVFELLDNGNQINELKALPAGVSATQLNWLAGTPKLIARGSDGKTYVGGDSPWTQARDAGYVASTASGRAWLADARSSLEAGGSIWYTSDGGATWTEAAGLPSVQTVEAVAPQTVDGTNVIAYLYGGDIYSSTDGGQSWTLAEGNLRSS